MTRTTLPRFLKRTLIISSAFAALTGGGAALASSASAAPLHLRPESFSIFISTFDQQGSVFASGPVRGFGTIQDPTASLAVLDLNFPHGTVNVRHTPEPAPVIDWRTCTATLDQYGEWEFTGGTGADWGAFGFGHFHETDFTVFKRGYFGQCEVNRAPLYFQVSVQAQGYAAR